ncbi:MAG: tetratricopeptide repeat protein [Odoribacter sp.]|nr:tetratricopeptide repeat protein [Odoribacter sp.]
MKLVKITILALAAAMCAPAAMAVIDNPMTAAVIKAYENILRSNPKDYLTLFRLSNEYYRHGEYVKALDNINNCLAYAPADNADGTRFQAFMIRAGIYNQTGRRQLALADLNSALAIEPQSMQALYQRANTALELGDYDQARQDYQRIQARDTRNADAIIGLARVAAAQNDYDTASDLLQQSVAFSPNEPESYIQRASVRKTMGDHDGAVEDLLVAISLGSKNQRAISALVDYGNSNYKATIDGLSRAIESVPGNGLYRYLRATIAQAHYNYLAAIDDFQTIIDQRLYNYHGLNASIARCELGLGRYDEALAQIDEAIKSSAGTVAEYYVVRSRIMRAQGRHDEAIAAANHAMVIDREYVPGLVEMALNYVDKKDYEQAIAVLGEASMLDADNPEIYLLRAWIHGTFLNQPAAARQFNQQALDVEGFADTDATSLRGFALMALDRTAEGDAWMETILNTVPDNDGRNNYLGACYWMLRGEDDKALQCVERSLQAGYSDNHNWMNNNDGPVNAGALRDDLRFLRLMQQYNYIFGK